MQWQQDYPDKATGRSAGVSSLFFIFFFVVGLLVYVCLLGHVCVCVC